MKSLYSSENLSEAYDCYHVDLLKKVVIPSNRMYHTKHINYVWPPTHSCILL